MGDLKGLTRKIEFNDAKNRKYNGYQRGIASMVYNFFDKKVSGKGIENEDILDQQSAENLYKPITRKFKIQEKKSTLISYR